MPFFIDTIVPALSSEEAAWMYLLHIGMIGNSTCRECNTEMNMIWAEDAFRCICGYQEAVEFCLQEVTHSRLSLRQIVLVLYEIAKSSNCVAQIAEVCGMDRKLVYLIKCEIADCLKRWMLYDSQEGYGFLGGHGTVVEIDEAFLGRRKNNRGSAENRRKGDPLLGFVERGSGRCYFVPVIRRTIVEMYPIILQHVLPGTIVVTDYWRSYLALSRDPDFQHYRVNHSVSFVSPEGYHTNTVEGSWYQVRKTIGTSKTSNNELTWMMARKRCALNTTYTFYTKMIEVITDRRFREPCT